MAADSAKRTVHNILVANSEDVVTLTQQWDAVEILNRHATGTLHYTTDNTPITAMNQNDTGILPPGQGVKVAPSAIGTTKTVIVRVFSDAACDYSVSGVSA